MDPQRFTSEEFGSVGKKPGDRWAFYHYQPKPMPYELTLSPATVMALSEADSALGRLSGVGRLLKDPSILVHPYLKREALASTRIEGTMASLTDVLRAEANEEPTDDEDVQEVLNYQTALYHGMGLLKRLPISVRLVREVHKVLLTGVRGQEKRPGDFRTSPVWIGSATDSPDTAAFVPPLPDDLGDLLADWERFVNEARQLPPLVRCALMHYQFETIHPFLDGNGRVGRLLIILMLLEEGLLSQPILYVSAYMETNRREYYERLQAVREEGSIQEWLQFFLTAVKRQAVDADNRAARLVHLRERYREQLSGVRNRSPEVVELLFSNPFITVRRVERALRMTNQGARNLIDSLERRGWLTRVGRIGPTGRIFWVCYEILETIG